MHFYKIYRRLVVIVFILTGMGCSRPGQQEEKVSIEFNENPFLGDIDAPAQLIIFTDFECDYCKQLAGYVDRIQVSHIKTGKVRVQIWDFPLDFHEHAFSSAICAYCAEKQGAYWDMYHLLYENQTELSFDKFNEFAGDLGLNLEVFKECTVLDQDSAITKIGNDILKGEEIGVNGTPAIVLNGNLYRGLPPEDVFLELLDGAVND